MTHHLDALGWTLIHFCWQAAAIALVYRVADAALVRARSHVRYALALGAMLSMLVTAVGTLAYEEMRGAPELSWPVMSHSSAARSIALGVAAVTGDSSITDLKQPAAQTLRHAAEFQPAGVMLWLDALWLLGVLSLSLRTIGGWWMIRRLRRTGLLAAPAAVVNALRTLCQRMGMRRRIDVYLCEQIGSPVVIGVFRSLVLLPVASLTALSPEQLEVVLAHELAHVRRADYFWNLMQTLIETIFFFHPAVWWMGRNLRQQRELCCDDFAVQCCSDPLLYASALLRLEEQRRTHLHLAMALDGNQSHFSLKTRISRILGDPPMRRSPKDLAPASLLGICTALALFLLPLPQLFASLSHPVKRLAPHISAAIFKQSVKETHAEKQTAQAVANVTRSVQAGNTVVVNSAHPRVSVTADAAVDSHVSVVANLAEAISPEAFGQEDQAGKSSNGQKHDYIDSMRAAGYDVDLDKYVSMKIQGVTPEYARDMAQIGFGKPTADELISMKIQGVDPAQVKEMKQAGLEPSSFNDLIQYRIFNVTPAFISAIKASGLGAVPPKKIVEMRIHGITPEYIQEVKKEFPDATVDDLVQMKIFNIDQDFIASAKRHGFTPITIKKLVSLRISGVMD